MSRLSSSLPALFALCLCSLPARAALDISPADGLPDIWAYFYNAAGLTPGGDEDADGENNLEEAIAGTNPKSSASVLKIKTFSKSGSNVTVVFAGLVGKRYEVQGAPSITGSFTTIAGAVYTPVADGDITSVVAVGANRFFRVLVSELDTDSDLLTNWEELKLGLNPSLADSNSDGTSDGAYVTAQLGLPNTVSIRPTGTFASEDGPTAGTFTVTRERTLFAITVPYTVSGTATAGTDYSSLSGSVSFAVGESSKEISVNPNPDGTLEGSESVTVTLSPPPPDLSTAYAIGNGTATVIIQETTAPTGTGLLARYYDQANANYAHAANFGDSANYAYTRGTPNTQGLIVVTPTTGNLTNILDAVSAGMQVKLTFLGGNLNTAAFNHANYTVTTKTASNFTVAISAATTLPTSSSSTANFSIQPAHPGVIERVDPTVNFEWGGGTANGSFITPGNSPDNYSSVWEGYLAPSVAGNYTFQLDADDRARVLLDTGSGLTQILEHGWDGPATVGTFNQSAAIALAVPATPAARYKIRVEHVDAAGEARCRLQWSRDGGAFANIPQDNVFSHTAAMSANYNYTRNAADTTIGTIVVTLNGHTFAVNDSVALYFSSGNLFTPPANYHGLYTITAVSGSTFTVGITNPAGLPASGTGAGFVLDQPNSASQGWFNTIYANTTFTAPIGRVGVDTTGPVTSNNGLYGLGSPDPSLIAIDSFSIRWTGQVQPQFSEEYTFVVHADDGVTLRVNGQTQEMRAVPASSTDGSTYLYDSTTGNTIVNYTGSRVKAGSYLVGETVRLDPTSGNLIHPNNSTYTYTSATGLAVIDYSNLTTVMPGGFAVGQIVEVDPTAGTASSLANARYTITAATATTFTVSFGVGRFADQAAPATINVTDNRDAVITAVHAAGTGTYNYSSVTGDAVVDYTALGIPANTIQVGNVLALDPSSGNLSTIVNSFATVTAATATTFTVSYGTSFTTGTGNIIIVAPSSAGVAQAITTAFTVNFEPSKYANASAGNVSLDIINKPLKDFSSMGNERYVRLPLLGGARYDIQLDYWENAGFSRCILYWYSPSQPKQVIPSERLYPSSVTQAPPAHTSLTEASALVGGVFSFPIAGSNGASVTISGNPAWLTYGGGNLVGTPPPGAAGDYQVIVTLTTAAGTSTSVLNLHVEENAGNVTREFWNGVGGTSIASIPTSNPPSGTSNLTSLEAPTDFGDNYGARIRGYITAPETGNYYFWIAASNAAELWISNDSETVNAYRRARVVTGSTTPQNWIAETNQKSPWLALEQGRKYYFEILHKAASGAGDNLAVGWLKPSDTGTAPSQVVPGYVLSPYIPPAPGSTPGTLYLATMLSQNGAVTNGVGSSTLRLSEDESYVDVKFSYSGLTGILTDWHIHNDPYLTHGSAIMYDPNAPPANSGVQPDSTPSLIHHKWTIPATVGTLSKAEVIELLKQGKAYINLHTALYFDGEIRGNYTLANGTRTFTPPPAPPAWTDDHATANGASRFLSQATFGANAADIAALKAMASYEAWIDDQFTKPATQHLPEVLAREIADVFGPFDVRVSFNTWWKNSISGSDQLRQRVAFALSQIHVVSGQGPLEDNSRALADFYDTLLTNAFGNFSDLLRDTTLTPGMGRYLDMLRNDKQDLSIGRIPNENYAREIKQLFSIGLFRMWPDGTLILNSQDAPIDTYTQREIVGLSHVFTGWDYGYDGASRTSFSAAADWTRPMREVPARHDTGPKRVLNNEVLPGLASVGGQPLDQDSIHTSTVINDPLYQALPAQEFNFVHDMLFNHPNTGPFICRQLIQRMVTSHPSRDYLYRVVQKFNDNGAGVRGDMKAVIKAILLDYEARSGTPAAGPAYGKQREPILRVSQAARAFRPANVTGTYSQTGSVSSANLPIITITTSTATPHLLSVGNSVFLEFTDTTGDPAKPAPTTGTYTVVTTPSTTSYTIHAPGWIAGTYNQTSGSSTMTITLNGHWLPAGGQAYFDFLTGTANNFAGFDQTVRTVLTSTAVDFPGGSGNNSGTTFTISAPNTTARSGNVMISRLAGSYQTVGGSYTIDTVYGSAGTFGTMADHHLLTGDNVFLNFITTRDTTSGNPTTTANDLVYPITAVPDLNTFTVTRGTAPNAAINSDNSVFVFPHKAQPLVRNGTIAARAGTYTMDNTDTDLTQTPLNSPTVFNYFLPDYKYAGTLASQGITTPEFEITSETTVVRQANFLYNGIFNPGSTTGISSFKGGTNALVLDLSPWMGNAVNTAGSIGNILGNGALGSGQQTGQVWTSNANVPTLIDRLNTLLLAGQLPALAKTEIQKLLGGQVASIGTGSPCTFNRSSDHGLAVGDSVTVTGISGGTWSGASTSGNGTFFVTAVPTSTSFRLATATTGGTNLNCTSTSGLSLTNSNAGIVPYTNSSPSATNIRDRLRAIVHLILTSPDYTVQQ
jgi:uncharacterized protein (DUF1800 family)